VQAIGLQGLACRLNRQLIQTERGIEMPHSLRKTNTTLWIVLAVLALAAITIIIAVTMSGGGGGGGGY
jgi:hypothetical protein